MISLPSADYWSEHDQRLLAFGLVSVFCGFIMLIWSVFIGFGYFMLWLMLTAILASPVVFRSSQAKRRRQQDEIRQHKDFVERGLVKLREERDSLKRQIDEIQRRQWDNSQDSSRREQEVRHELEMALAGRRQLEQDYLEDTKKLQDQLRALKDQLAREAKERQEAILKEKREKEERLSNINPDPFKGGRS